PPVARSAYLKIRDRASYEFALVSVAAALVIDEGVVVDAKLALGGGGTIPWRARAGETRPRGGVDSILGRPRAAGAVLLGVRPEPSVFAAAASAAISDPFTVEG